MSNHTRAVVAAIASNQPVAAQEAFQLAMQQKLRDALDLRKVEVAHGLFQESVLVENYNGWTNRQTWNVALWIGNDEGLYHRAREFAAAHPNPGVYRKFATMLVDSGNLKTKDGVRWNDSELNHDELDEMMIELVG